MNTYMNTYTDTQLKQALAKMLPEQIRFMHDERLWKIDSKGNLLTLVLDTELLHLCWLVEEHLTQDECNRYSQELRDTQLTHQPTALGWFFHATWQQRTIALCKVKGIEI